MRQIRNKRFVVLVIATLFLIPGLSQAQFSNVVFDPTNYKNALLRYIQLQQQLEQWRGTQPPRSKLPESIWQSAAAAAKQYGVYAAAGPLLLQQPP